jgi:uncharacterized protein (UPF0333 family)
MKDLIFSIAVVALSVVIAYFVTNFYSEKTRTEYEAACQTNNKKAIWNGRNWECFA